MEAKKRGEINTHQRRKTIMREKSKGVDYIEEKWRIELMGLLEIVSFEQIGGWKVDFCWWLLFIY